MGILLAGADGVEKTSVARLILYRRTFNSSEFFLSNSCVTKNVAPLSRTTLPRVEGTREAGEILPGVGQIQYDGVPLVRTKAATRSKPRIGQMSGTLDP